MGLTLKQKSIIIIIVIVYITLLVIGCIHIAWLNKNEKAVVKIHATKLARNDVFSGNIPPDPQDQKDITVQGIDINKNGVRDDVELGIFKHYPNSAKIRAALLQYALVLQMETLYPISKKTATAVAEADSRSYDCIGRSIPDSENSLEKIAEYRSFVENLQLETPERKNIRTLFDNKTGTFELQSGCDINLESLPD